MQRIVIPAVLTVLAAVPASAGPRDLSPPPRPDMAFAQMFAAPPPAPPRALPAAAPQYYGGGFLEFLFAPPRRQEAPAYGPPQYGAPDGRTPAYYRPQPGDAPGASSAYYQAGQPYRAMDPRFLPQQVYYETREKPGTIVINTNERFLYLVEGHGRATRYGIGVGRPGFSWAGVHTVTQKREWPDWTPPDEMLQRRPDLPRHMEGGPENPLGARAMYLGSTLYRIHGSNEPWTIGTAVSSGCIRMRNEDVIDLYNRIPVGTKVMVI